MKSTKKLFAILTLMMFMMTLLPMAAFAAAPNRFASVASSDKTTAVADGTETVKFTVYLFDATNVAATPQPIYVASDRGTTDTFMDTAGVDLLAATGTNVFKTANSAADGKIEFKLKSSVSGVAKIAIGLQDRADYAAGPPVVPGSLYEYLVGVSTATSTWVDLVKTFDITFTAGTTDGIAYQKPTTNDGTDVIDVATTGATSALAYNLSTGTMLANGVEYYEVAFKVTSGTTPVSGETITWTVDNVQVGLNKTTATTDAAGLAKVKVTSTKPGTFALRGEAGGKSKTVYLKFASSGTYDLSLISGGNETIARSEDYTIKFKLADSNGNKVSVATGPFNVTQTNTNYGVSFTATTRPTDVAMVEDITTAGGAVNYVVTGDSNGYLAFKIKGAVLNKDGSYVVKAYLANGKSVSVPFTVAKQGDVTRVALSYPSTAYALGATTDTATVKYYDANDIVKKVEATAGGGEFAGLVSFAVTPAYRATVSAFNDGVLTLTAVKDDVGEFVVTAIDTVNNLTSSYSISVTKAVSHFMATAPAETTAPGTNAPVAIKFVDKDGASTSLGNAGVPTLANYYVVSKPSGAIVSVSAEGEFSSKIQDTGAAVINVNSNIAGDVTVQFVINDGVATSYTGSATMTFASAPVPAPVIGANAVTMFIGATGFMKDGAPGVTDVAPFIQDGRTFVAVRPVADAFGAEIGWDEATQTVTLTRSDKTVTIVIGSNTITIVKDGVTSTVTADVAAMIKDGRTVLPFRAVGEAFGATVSYDAATQSVSYQQ